MSLSRANSPPVLAGSCSQGTCMHEEMVLPILCSFGCPFTRSRTIRLPLRPPAHHSNTIQSDCYQDGVDAENSSSSLQACAQFAFTLRSTIWLPLRPPACHISAIQSDCFETVLMQTNPVEILKHVPKFPSPSAAQSGCPCSTLHTTPTSFSQITRLCTARTENADETALCTIRLPSPSSAQSGCLYSPLYSYNSIQLYCYEHWPRTLHSSMSDCQE